MAGELGAVVESDGLAPRRGEGGQQAGDGVGGDVSSLAGESVPRMPALTATNPARKLSRCTKPGLGRASGVAMPASSRNASTYGGWRPSWRMLCMRVAPIRVTGTVLRFASKCKPQCRSHPGYVLLGP